MVLGKRDGLFLSKEAVRGKLGALLTDRKSPRLAWTPECRFGKTRVFSNSSASIARSLVFDNPDRGAFPVCAGVVSRRERGCSGAGVLRAPAIGFKNQAFSATVPGAVQALPNLFPHSSR